MDNLINWPVIIAAGVAYYFFRRNNDEAVLSDVYSLLSLQGEIEASRGNIAKSKELYDMASALHDARRYVKYQNSRPPEKPTGTILLLGSLTSPYFLEELYRHKPGGQGAAYEALMRLWGKLEKCYKQT
ncbi:hypothetical protein VDF76_19175 [Xanthomonas campestris pv. raphani]|uniref:hypothetical protein n=1 Tax=Xanthomonas campestris TaxID=339 RepID=UPI0011C01B84|nr:hypothetical protein [Xanthomonas campestris]MEA9749077.1 hypothetical protein [Xanthomonas campestris pv. raphani]MEA9845794.1 hypothetical protein [Xanthomonas campestris pv. raphani]MEA9849789.1 hypothetical protein [Xanthomonas campestris pv. raphani]MEA9930950.1 hypothetical protein [Xanthomonas campestris pv. raphani]